MPNKPLNILVGLDLSEMDPYIVRYLHSLNGIFKIERVTFLHNIKLAQLPKEYLTSERLHEIRDKITDKVKEMVTDKKSPYACEVQVTMDRFSEASFENISKANHYDLLVMGNKQHLEGNGALSKKLTQLFPASVMLIPEIYTMPIKNIIRAITFSKYTKGIIQWGDHFEENSAGDKINHRSVYVSKLFYYPLMSWREAHRLTQRDFKEKEEKWKKHYGQYGKLELVSAEEKGVASTLKQYARQKGADVIVMGVKGESKIRNLFIGSVANEMLQRPTATVLLFVKPEKRGSGTGEFLS